MRTRCIACEQRVCQTQPSSIGARIMWGDSEQGIPDSYILILVLDQSAAVVVYVQIVRRAEDGDDRRELLSRGLAVHRVSCVLRFMTTKNPQELIALEELARSLVSVDPRALVRIACSRDIRMRAIREVVAATTGMVVHKRNARRQSLGTFIGRILLHEFSASTDTAVESRHGGLPRVRNSV